MIESVFLFFYFSSLFYVQGLSTLLNFEEDFQFLQPASVSLVSKIRSTYVNYLHVNYIA